MFWHGSTSNGFWHKQCELPSNGVADHGTNKTALQGVDAAPMAAEATKVALCSKNPLFWYAKYAELFQSLENIGAKVILFLKLF